VKKISFYSSKLFKGIFMSIFNIIPFQPLTPFVKVVVNIYDIPIIRNAISSSPKHYNIAYPVSDTVKYLDDTAFNHAHSDLVRIELNMEYDVPIILESIKNKFFLGLTPQSEIRNRELWKLVDLMSALPAQYSQQILSNKIAHFK